MGDPVDPLDALDALDAAHAYFRRGLAAVRPAHLDLPTPCAEWTVRALLEHVVGGQVRYAMLLAGAATSDVEATRDHDHLRADPLAASDAAWTRLRAAFHEPDALDRIVHHRGGDRTGHDLLLMRTVEEAVHGWDLARALGSDDVLDERLAADLTRRIEEHRSLWAPPGGVLAPPQPVGAAATPEQRLLAATGRLTLK